MKRALRYVLILAVPTALLAAGVSLVRGSSDEPADGEIRKVKRATVKLSVQEVGTIEPMRRVEIKSKVAGQVLDVLVDVGDEIRAGDPLLELDALDAQRALQTAQARTKVTQAKLVQAKEQVAFKHHAHQKGTIAQMELSAVQGDVRSLSAEAAVNAAEINALRDQVTYARVRSPIDGVVLARNVQPGEMVTPGIASLSDGRPLLVVAQVDKLLVRTELNQIDVTRLKQGAPAEVRVDAVGDKVFHGQIYRIAAMAQRSVRRAESNLQVFPVDVVVSRDQPGADALRAGMVADLNVDVAAHENVLTVPLEALVRENGKTRLRKVNKDGKDTLVDVSIGFQNDELVEITSGIEEGASIRVLPADASAQMAQ